MIGNSKKMGRSYVDSTYWALERFRSGSRMPQHNKLTRLNNSYRN